MRLPKSFLPPVIVSILGAIAIFFATSAHAYYGKRSAESRIEFDARLELYLPGEVNLDILNRETRARAVTLRKVAEQIRHLHGWLQSPAVIAELGGPGALGEGYGVRFTRVNGGGNSRIKTVTYHFEGAVALPQAAIAEGGARDLNIRLPLDPDAIFALTWVEGVGTCSDPEYRSSLDFWYFWDPERKGCAIQANDRDLLRIGARLTRLPTARGGDPEYARLYGDNGNGPVFSTAIFIADVDESLRDRAPRRGPDARAAFKATDLFLREQGFAVTRTKAAFREGSRGRDREGRNFIRWYEREIIRGEKSVRLRVFLMLGDAAETSGDPTLMHHLAEALPQADLVIYDGHSGLGGMFDLKAVPRASFVPEKYQIFYVNGAGTLPYFNGAFFFGKEGTRNLELVTAGLPTMATAESRPGFLVFLEPFLQGKQLSYPALLDRVEAAYGNPERSLLSVRGNEDNPVRK